MVAIEEAKFAIVEDGYDINCTGDCCVGDNIKFFNAGKSSEPLCGEIISESYGQARQQHTFTVEVEGEKMMIKGRNLYKNGVLRKKWNDENKRSEILEEKHQRGSEARNARKQRLANKEFNQDQDW